MTLTPFRKESLLTSYCDVAPGHEWHGPYHDTEYGFPLRSDAELFERLMLEINQAGLSWLTILKKREAFRRAYDGFDPAKVARYGARERRRLLADAGIVRNRLKVEAAIANAKAVLTLGKSHGSFAAWLEEKTWTDGRTEGRKEGGKAKGRSGGRAVGGRRRRTKEEWVALFKQTFRFTGGEIVGEFLVSTGFLPGAHVPECPVYATIVRLKPAWSREPGSWGAGEYFE